MSEIGGAVHTIDSVMWNIGGLISIHSMFVDNRAVAQSEGAGWGVPLAAQSAPCARAPRTLMHVAPDAQPPSCIVVIPHHAGCNSLVLSLYAKTTLLVSNEFAQHGDSDVCKYAIHRRQSLLQADGLLQHYWRLIRLCLRPRNAHTRKLCMSCVAYDFAMRWIRYTCLFIYVLNAQLLNCLSFYYSGQYITFICNDFRCLVIIIIRCRALCEINISDYLNKSERPKG